MDLRRQVGKRSHGANFITTNADRRAAAANQQVNAYYGAGSQMAQYTNAQNKVASTSKALAEGHLREMRARYNGEKGRSDCMVDRQKERDLWVSSHIGDEVMCACFVSL